MLHQGIGCSPHTTPPRSLVVVEERGKGGEGTSMLHQGLVAAHAPLHLGAWRWWRC